MALTTSRKEYEITKNFVLFIESFVNEYGVTRYRYGLRNIARGYSQQFGETSTCPNPKRCAASLRGMVY